MKTRLILISSICVIAVVYGLIGIDYMKQQKSQQALASSISDITRSMKQIPETPQGLDQKLASARAALETAQSAFPTRTNSTQIINKILLLADECRVQAVPLTTQQWTASNTVKGYQVLRLHVTVQGDFTALVTFVGKLENGLLDTVVIENLSVDKVIIKTGEKAPEGQALPVKAGMDLAIYARTS